MRVISIFKIRDTKKNTKKGQMSLEMIIGLIILLVVAAVVIKIFMDRMSGDDLAPPETLELEAYRTHCEALCSRYVETNFAPAEALAYCEKSFEIDLNKNGKIPGEVGKLNAYGLCEEKVYCMNIKECNWGSSKNSRLTPQKCRDIMCDAYTERQGGLGTPMAPSDNNVTAAAYIKQKIEFGSCDPYDEEIAYVYTDPITGTQKMVSLASWYLQFFANNDDDISDPLTGVLPDETHCRGLSG